MTWRRFLLLIAVVATPRGALGDTTGGLARCAAVQAPDARLACYDALAGRHDDPASTPPEAASAVSAQNDPKNFGLNPVQMHVPAPELAQSVTARVTRIADDGRGHMILGLDNDQTWSTDEVDSRLGVGDTVSIRRATLGSFLLVTPTKRSYRAHRTQ